MLETMDDLPTPPFPLVTAMVLLFLDDLACLSTIIGSLSHLESHVWSLTVHSSSPCLWTVSLFAAGSRYGI